MRSYLGQMYLAITVLLGIAGVLIGWQVVVTGGLEEPVDIILLFLAMLSWITALLTAAASYVAWMPKWERDERRGRGLAEAMNMPLLPLMTPEQRERAYEAHRANQEGMEQIDD